MPILLAIGGGLVVATALVLWRVWPVLWGRARPQDVARVRHQKWNTHLAPMLQKLLRGKAIVGRARRLDGDDQATLGTWALVPTLIPDVDYVAIAEPGADEPTSGGDARIAGVVMASALRALLGEFAHKQDLWGHTAWIYAWRPDADVRTVVETLIPLDEFKKAHGWVA